MDTFQALADPTRRHILELLAKKGSLQATEIYTNFSSTPPAISQHLKVLKEADLVQVEKKAQRRLYKINPKKVSELETWIHKIAQEWEARLTRLDSVLAEEKKKQSYLPKLKPR